MSQHCSAIINNYNYNSVCIYYYHVVYHYYIIGIRIYIIIIFVVVVVAVVVCRLPRSHICMAIGTYLVHIIMNTIKRT